MSDQFLTGIVTIFMGLIGVATIAVVLSKNANTTGVVAATTGGFASDLEAALGPIDGGGSSLNFSSSL